MSIRVMTKIWESELPRDEKYVALCLADFGNDDGVGIYPSIGYICWKTGYSETQARVILHSLRSRGVIEIRERASKYGTNEYMIVTAHLPERPSYRASKVGRPEGLPNKTGTETEPDNKLGTETEPDNKLGTETVKLGTETVKLGTETVKLGTETEPESSVNREINREVLANGKTEKPLFDLSTVEGKYRARVFEALKRGIEANESIEWRIEKCFGISPNWKHKTEQEFVAWIKNAPKPQTIEAFAEWWYREDWRGKKGQPPTLRNIRELWPQAFKDQPRQDDQSKLQTMAERFTRITAERERAAGSGAVAT